MHGNDLSSHTAQAPEPQPSVQSTEAQPPQLHLDLTISQECLATTNQYCCGSVSKVAAILVLQAQLNSTDEHFKDSLGSYIWILNNFEQFHNDASSHGQTRIGLNIRSDDEADRLNNGDASQQPDG